MGATLQVVHWALERSCPMRQGENWAKPKTTQEQLRDVKLYDLAMAEGRLFEGICVTSESIGMKFRPPALYGFIVNETFAKFGGLQVIEQSCRNCQANVQVNDSQEERLAGCHNTLFLYPNDEEIQQAAKANEITSQLQDLFLPTNPLWFGLWANSPLTVDQCGVLIDLLSGIPIPESEKKRVDHFLTALSIATQHGLKLHVSLTPPGHLDNGWRSIWSHCPRCNAGVIPSKMDKMADSTDVICQVCNYRFNPEPTYSFQPDGLTEIYFRSLEVVLGKEQCNAFIHRYLQYQGHSQAEIDQMFALNDIERVQGLIYSHTNEEIATILNQEGRKTQQGKPYTIADIHNLCRRHKIRRRQYAPGRNEWKIHKAILEIAFYFRSRFYRRHRP